MIAYCRASWKRSMTMVISQWRNTARCFASIWTTGELRIPHCDFLLIFSPISICSSSFSRQQRFKFADDLSHISNSIQIVTYDDQTPVETMVFITDNAIDALDNKPNPKVSFRIQPSTFSDYLNIYFLFFRKQQNSLNNNLTRTTTACGTLLLWKGNTGAITATNRVAWLSSNMAATSSSSGVPLAIKKSYELICIHQISRHIALHLPSTSKDFTESSNFTRDFKENRQRGQWASIALVLASFVKIIFT